MAHTGMMDRGFDTGYNYLLILVELESRFSSSTCSNQVLESFIQFITSIKCCKGKGLPQQAEVAQGVPGRFRPRIFLTFGTMRVVGHQPYAPATFTPGEIPGTHF